MAIQSWASCPRAPRPQLPFQRMRFPLYKRLRDHHPLFHDRFHNRWALTRYRDIDGAVQDNQSYDRAVYKPGGPYEFGSTHVFGPNILEYGNSPRHRWLRNIVAGQFVGTRNLFGMREEGDPVVKLREITTPELELHARRAAEVCPAGAILLEE